MRRDPGRSDIRFATRSFERIRWSASVAPTRHRGSERETPTRAPTPGGADSARQPPPLQVQAEPPFHLGVPELAQDPVDRVPVGWPDDEAQRFLAARPAEAVVLVREGRLGAGA